MADTKQQDVELNLDKKSASDCKLDNACENNDNKDKQEYKKIRLFLSRKIWIAIFSFLGLTIIGGIIEYSVQTPISQFFESLNGPSIKILNQEIERKNYLYVYNNISQEFYGSPQNRKFESLYNRSTKGHLQHLLDEHQWNEAFFFLSGATKEMPISKSHLLHMRRIYVQAQPELMMTFKKKNNSYGADFELFEKWKETKKIAALEKDDAVIQFEAGRACAQLNWVGGKYNLESMTYFKKALELHNGLKEKPIIFEVLKQALEQYSDNQHAENARKMIKTYYLEMHLQRLKENLKPYSFKHNQTVEETEQWNKRLNSFLLLSESNTLEPVDEFRFYLMAVAHFNNANKQNLLILDQAEDYFKTLHKNKTYDLIRQKAAIGDIVPASVLTEGKTSKKYKLTWPIINEILPGLFSGYCLKKKDYDRDVDLRDNCRALLKQNSILPN